MKRAGKRRRQEEILAILNSEPLLTDEELARRFSVSIQTIRLDRLELGLPEMRERAKRLAEVAYARVRSVTEEEVVGQLVEVDLGRMGVSVLETGDAMAFARTGIVRGHHIFAQGNSLAVAIINAAVALTGRARLFFVRPVYVGEVIVARAEVVRSRQETHLVAVSSRVSGEEVFRGQFIVVSREQPVAVGGASTGPQGTTRRGGHGRIRDGRAQEFEGGR